MSSFTWKRLLWLATCGVFVACASAPAPTPTKKKKKKRSKDRVALKKKKEKDEDKREDEEKPDKPAKQDKDEKAEKSEKAEKAEKDEDTVIVSDESDDETAGKNKKKKKKKAKDDEENSSKKDPADEESEDAAVKKKKKKKKAKDEEDGEEVASKSKKKKDEAKKKKKEAEEEEARKKQEAEEEELARKEAEKEEARKKKEEEEEARKQKEEEELAAKAKKKKKKKKGDETKVAAKAKHEDEEEAAEEEVAEEEEPKSKAKKKPVKVAKAAKKNADVDMTSDENTIDMEDDSSGSSLDSRVEDQPPERRAVAIAVPGVDDDSSGGEVAKDTTPIGTNPLVINERPLVLPKGKFSVHGGLRVGVLTLPNVNGTTTSTTSTGLALGLNYGASDDAEVGLDYTAGLSPGSAKGPVTLHGAYSAIKGKLDLAVAGALAVDFSAATMAVPSKAFFALELGAWARYRLTRKASVFSGVPALPNSTVSLTKLSFPLPPLPYQLAIGLNNAGTIALDLPVGVGYQATPKIYAFGLLDLAHIRISNTENAFLFKDFIPLSLGGFYALDKLDIGVLFSDDLKQGSDYLRFDTVVRYSIK